MTGWTDWKQTGVWPLQDHAGERSVSMRQTMAGARLAKLVEPGTEDNPDESWAEFALENDHGTLGDIHPWLFWQTANPEARGMGSWSMAWGAITSEGGGSSGGGRGGRGPTTPGSSPLSSTSFYDIGTEILPRNRGRGGSPGGGSGGTEEIRVQPFADGKANPDTRYVAKAPGWPKCFSAVPQGVEVMVVPATSESTQAEVMLWADPRLFAVHTEGPAECGTLVVDLQPEAEPCMDGAEEPGIEGRAARLQTAWRVIPRKKSGGPTSGSEPPPPTPYIDPSAYLNGGTPGPGDLVNATSTGPKGLKDLGAKDGNLIAWNLSLSALDKLAGFGAIWAKLDSVGGTNTGDNKIGNRTRNVGSGGEGDAAQGPCKFGKFEKKTEARHGIAFMAALDAWGPIHAGAHDDKHRIDRDRDGHPMNSAHISTNALYFRDRDEDGPLYFQGEYPETSQFPLWTDVELVWDEDIYHDWIDGSVREGKWRWVAKVPQLSPPTTPPDEPPGGPGTPGRPGRPGRPTTPGGPPPPPRNPTTPGTPGSPGTPRRGPTTPGTGGSNFTPGDNPGEPRPRGQFNFVLPGEGPRPPIIATSYQEVGQTQAEDVSVYVIHHPFHESFAELSFRPQHWQDGLLDFARNPYVDVAQVRDEETYRPTVLSMHSWGAQEGDGWDYTDEPHDSRARGGTASGGILFAPPHLQMEDFLSGGDSTPTTLRTTSYICAAPNVAFALGTPNTDGGLDEASVIIAQDTSTNRVLSIYQLDSTRTPVTLISGHVDQSSGEVIVGLARGGTTCVRLPEGTTAQRPASPTGGEVRINSSSGTDTLEWYDSQGAAWISAGTGGGGGATTFTGLTDTPSSFSGSGGYLVRVNSDATALEFVDGSTVYQPLDAELTALAGLTSAADKLPYFTGSGTAALADLSSFARTILDDADAASVRTTIDAAQTSHTHAASDITSGTFDDARIAASNVTQHEASLTILESQITDGSILARRAAAETITGVWGFDPNSASAEITYFVNSGAGTHAIVTDGGLGILNGAFVGAFSATPTATRVWTMPDATGTVALTSDLSSYQPLDTELTALAGLTSAADRLPYFTGSGTASLATFTSFARTILDDADAATVRTTIDAAQTSHTHAASDVTSGTFDDARIAESSVTQHEAALTITESQITDGSVLARVAGSETITGAWAFTRSSGLDVTTEFSNTGAGTHYVRVDGYLVLGTATWAGTIARTGLTADRTWTFPDKTGTVAMTSDITGWPTTFLDLSDTPASYTGSTDKVLSSSGSAVQFEAPTTTSAGVADAGKLVRLDASGHFDTSLVVYPAYSSTTEGPGSFSGNAGAFVRVNTGETSMEYVAPLSSSSGAGDAGKPIVLDAGGHVDATMINDADIDHGSVGGLTDDDHTQYLHDTPGTTARNQVKGSAATVTPLTLQAHLTQTADIFAIDTAVTPSAFKVDKSAKCTAYGFDASLQKITRVADGTASTDAINLGQLDGRCEPTITVGTSFPGSPTAGDKCIRTDLDYDEFVYTGSAWIGSSWVFVEGGINANGITAAQYALGGPGNQSLAFRSNPLPWDAKLVSVTSYVGGTVSNTDIIVRRNGTNVVTVNVAAANTGVTGTVTPQNDDTFGSGDMVQIYVDPTPGSDSINAPRVAVWFRRRAT